MSQLRILSATNLKDLVKEAEELKILQVGALTVSNGQYFLTLLIEPKVPEVKPKVTQEVPEVKPKVTPKTPTKKVS